MNFELDSGLWVIINYINFSNIIDYYPPINNISDYRIVCRKDTIRILIFKAGAGVTNDITFRSRWNKFS